MNFYRIAFAGVYLGGVAIVAAETAEEAFDLAMESASKTIPGLTLQKLSIQPIPVPGPCVMYLDNGDY